MSPEQLALFTKFIPLACKRGRVYFARYGNRLGDVEDWEQEAAIGLQTAAETWDESRGAKFITYAWRVISNRLHDLAKLVTHRFQDRISTADFDLTYIPDADADPAEAIANFSAIDAMDQLEEPMRRVVRLRYVEGVARRLVARRLKMKWWKIAAIEHRGLKALRRALG